MSTLGLTETAPIVTAMRTDPHVSGCAKHTAREIAANVIQITV